MGEVILTLTLAKTLALALALAISLAQRTTLSCSVWAHSCATSRCSRTFWRGLALLLGFGFGFE